MNFHFSNALGLTLLIFIAVLLWAILTHWMGYVMFGAICLVCNHYWREHQAKKLKKAQQEDDNVYHLARPIEPR